MKMSAICAATVAVLAGGAASFADFTYGNLVVSVINGTTNAAQSVSLLEFTPATANQASPVSTTALPTLANGTNHRFTLSGSATSEGALTLSADGRYLTIGGYDAALATASVAATTSAANPRVVARIGFDTSVDTSTALTDAYSGNNIRSVVSSNGTDFWTGGPNTSGIRYATLGGTTSTSLITSNVRVVNIYNNQLYVSASSSPNFGVMAVGTGLPTTAGQTATILPGMPTVTGPSSYDFFFASSTLMYVADDRTSGSNGGIQKWTFNGTNWSLAGTFSTSATIGMRGLTGSVDGLGNATLFAISTDNKLVSFTEAGGFTTLATAAAGTVFRGVDFSPVPAPGTLVLMGAGVLAVGVRRRK